MDAVYLLALLICPIGMGLMMWFMAKGMRSSGKDHDRAGNLNGRQTDDRPVEELRQEHEGLSGEIERLERREYTSG